MTSHARQQRDALLRVAVPNKGSLSAAAARDAREAGYRQRHDSKKLTVARPRQRRGVLLPAPARHRAVRRRGHPRRRHHRPRPAARLRAPRPRRSLPLGFGAVAVPLRGPAGHARLARRPRPASGSRRRTSASYAVTWRSAASRPRWSGSTARSRRSIQLGVADVIADVVETGSTLQGGRARARRRRDPGVRGGADHPRRRRGADRLRGVPAPPRRRPGRPRLRDDGLRHARATGSRTAVALTPGLESPTVSPLHREGWVAVRAMVPRGGQPAADGRALRARCPRRSCSPTSMPAGSEASAPLPVTLPHTWRPRGVRVALLGGRHRADGPGRRGLDRHRRATSAASSPRSSGPPWSSSAILLFITYYALVRCKVVASGDRADGGQRLPHAAFRVVPGDRPVAAPRGARGPPSTSPTAPRSR